jgi:uncharacterized protein YcbX
MVPSSSSVACVAAAGLGAWLLMSKRPVWLFGTGGWKHVGEVVALHVYPVKSCRGIEVEQMELDRYGPKLDRRFMIVDENGRFITQRQEAILSQIFAEMLPDGRVTLSVSNKSHFTFKPATAVSLAHPQVDAGVWDDEVLAIDQGMEVASWLVATINRPVRLVGMTQDFERPTSRKYTPKNVPGQTGFSDGFPMLLLSEESLEDLNSRLSTPLPMNRFRPNIVVKGCKAYDEDKWRTIFIGGSQYHIVKPCSRCKITTTDQETGYRGEEPLTTLSTYRLKSHVKAPCGDKVDVFFGQNICHEGPGTLTQGDMVFARYWTFPWFLRNLSYFY